MSSLNQVTLLGRVGGDPQTTTAQSGNQVARFTLATSRKSNGVEETQWHNISCFGKAAEFVGKYVKKGDCVLVIGEIKYSKFTNNKGEDKYVTNILVSNVQLCSSKANNNVCPKEQDDLPEDIF